MPKFVKCCSHRLYSDTHCSTGELVSSGRIYRVTGQESGGNLILAGLETESFDHRWFQDYQPDTFGVSENEPETEKIFTFTMSDGVIATIFPIEFYYDSDQNIWYVTGANNLCKIEVKG